ncbi:MULTISPECIES: hypothetical protein [unclassified Aeromicrobium]|uniref:hypothetical protein n=1 Tax=unclassified Aeromicrobium TaxID=2633570 RepID=UPI00396B1928
MRRVLMVLAGLVIVLPLVYLDPAAIVLLDVEFLIALVSVAWTMTRENLRLLWHRIAIGDTVAFVRAGWRMTRAEPRSAWHGTGDVSRILPA